MNPTPHGPFNHWGAYSHFPRTYRWSPRRPSRVVWFLIGSVTTAWFIKHHNRLEEGHGKFYASHCVRRPVAPMVPPVEATGGEWSPRIIAQAVNNIPAENQPAPVAESVERMNPWGRPWGFSQEHIDAHAEMQREWAAEKERVLALGKQAGDTVADLSEATLDSILGTVEGLKLKLAQHRIQRELEQKRLEDQIEREKNQPHRFV